MSEKDIEKLIKENNELHTENVAFRTEISVLKEEMAVMQNQLDWFKRQMFGRKTERKMKMKSRSVPPKMKKPSQFRNINARKNARLKMQWVNFLQKKSFMNLKKKYVTNAEQKWLR